MTAVAMVAAVAAVALVVALVATSGGDSGGSDTVPAEVPESGGGPADARAGSADGFASKPPPSPTTVAVATSPSGTGSATAPPPQRPAASLAAARPAVRPATSPSTTRAPAPLIVLVPGKTTVLPAGLARLAPSGKHELLRLTMTSLADNRTILVGRAYGGYAWETGPTYEDPLVFDCNNSSSTSTIRLYRSAGSATTSSPICMVRVPGGGRRRRQSAAAVRFQIDTFDLSGTEPDARSMAARFLMRATFGPTRRSIEEFLTEHRGSPAAWIKDQIAAPATLLRAFHRRHANPRISDEDVPLLWAARVRSACSGGSRWNRHAFGGNDLNQILDVTSAGADGFALSILSITRAVVDPAVLQRAVLNPPGSRRW